MNKFKINFPTLSCILFSSCSFLHIFIETSRVVPTFQNIYIEAKFVFGFLGLFLAIFHSMGKKNDLLMGGTMVVMVAYCLTFMWLAPLYEFAYLEIAIGSSFFRLRRNWLFPLIFGLGFFWILVTYFFQDKLHWQMPAISRSDYVFICFIIFSLSWFIQKYAIGSFRNEEDRLSRFGLIGIETTRLVHDIKGLLSSPLMLIENLKSNNFSLAKGDYEQHMLLLSQDMENIHNVVLSINRLVAIDNNFSDALSLNESIQSAMNVLERRLGGIEISLPEEKMIQGNPDRLHSIFFNLILNSIEAFGRNIKITDYTTIKRDPSPINPPPKIEMFWQDSFFIYRDNAGGIKRDSSTLVAESDLGGFASSKGRGSGLGLSIINNDLNKMGASMKVSSISSVTTFKVLFSFPKSKIKL